ncbi:MAG TPA: DedA family protein [Anaerolineales bacterium]|nr:DedA family protein [Anaerolineales bacterium]
MTDKRRLSILRGLSLFAVIGISVFIYSVRDQVEQFAGYGYPGVFIIALLSYATVLLPAPSLAVVFTIGGVFHPLGVALSASAGAAIGELSGYMAGFSGQAVVERMDIYNRIMPWIDKYGIFAIFVLAIIPNPFFDLAGIAAGVVRIPIKSFLLACWLGQFIKATVFAYAGAASINWFTLL